MPEYSYNDETHEYRIDGVIVPSVTQVLSCLSDFRFVDEDVMRRAQQFGKAVHLMAQLYLEGRLDEDALDEGLMGPLKALKKWKSDYGCHPIIMNSIIDIKSREFDPIKDPLQLAGYALLWREAGREGGTFYEHPFFSNRLKLAGTPDILEAQHNTNVGDIKIRYVLTLRQDCTYSYVNARRPQDDAMFKKMLEAWHYNANMEKLINGWRKS